MNALIVCFVITMTGHVCGNCSEVFRHRFNFMVHRLKCGRYQLRYQCVHCDAIIAWHHGMKRHYDRLHQGIPWTHFVLADCDTHNGKYRTSISMRAFGR